MESNYILCIETSTEVCSVALSKSGACIDEKSINEPDLLNKLNDPEYINALKNALIRYQINNKKQNKQADSLQKLIDNLKKKK